jgi:hypothetical protein
MAAICTSNKDFIKIDILSRDWKNHCFIDKGEFVFVRLSSIVGIRPDMEDARAYITVNFKYTAYGVDCYEFPVDMKTCEDVCTALGFNCNKYSAKNIS